MLSCTACIRRALNNLSPTIKSSRSLHFYTSRTGLLAQSLYRNHSTLRAIRTGHHRRELLHSLKKSSKGKPDPNKASVRKVKREALKEKDEAARIHNRNRLLNSPSSATKSILSDRVQLASEVLNLLKKEQLVKALTLCRLSEKGIDGAPPVDSVVSWNHIIDWLMLKEDTGLAWKVFNEMKKRGHKPSAQTITIMLRGYMENPKQSRSTQQALAVYNSMFGPHSTVKPSIIHSNAILSVCARARDMDSLWGIAGRLPERGPDAADRRTYTTILMAMTADVRAHALELGSKEQNFRPEERGLNTEKLFQQAIEGGQRLWTEVIARWRRGDLEIDAKLTCAMGRLLMLSSERKHHHEIFALIEQTMNLSRFDERLELKKKESPSLINADPEPTNVSVTTEQSVGEDTSQTGVMSIVRETSAESPSEALSLKNGSAYAVPDNNTLSLLLETALSLKDPNRGKHYWETITSPTGPYRLQPDGGTFTLYLRLLRSLRASQTSLDVLKSIPDTIWKTALAYRGVFMIAMSTCVRDRNNPNVFDTACRLIDLMQAKAEVFGFHQSSFDNHRTASTLSPKVLTLYVQLAIATTRGINGEKLTKDVKTGDLNFERNPRKNNVLRALNRLTSDTLNVKRMIKLNVAEYERQLAQKSRTPRVQSRLREQAEAPADTQELVDYLTTLIGAYDKLLLVNEKLEDEGLGPLDSQIVADFVREKRKLSAFVGMVNNVPGIASRYKKIKEFLEPLEKEDEERREEISNTVQSSALAEIRDEIQTMANLKEKKKLLRGLSIRQKRELQKELHARTVDPNRSPPPDSPEPLAPRPTRPMRAKDAAENGKYTGSKSVTFPGFAGIKRASRPAVKGEVEAPLRVRKPLHNGLYPTSKSMTLPRFGAIKKIDLSDIKDERTSDQTPKYASRRKPQSPYANSPGVKGWGGGFSELAKKQGQPSTGLVDLGR
ncbi:hypothetical protein LTR84_004706 [Exophiala bonariae]|uniref:Pentatricopeptide repeat protein n=1 Tax=Exophiala bonariae TaxID=1690606 RepID=A0AAV9NNC0_9EURO|nr:hypothetical protein LTR84_004706 [Exophiala bonariae]